MRLEHSHANAEANEASTLLFPDFDDPTVKPLDGWLFPDLRTAKTDEVTVADLIKAHLEHCENRYTGGTMSHGHIDNVRRDLRRFAGFMGDRLASDMREEDIVDFVLRFPKWHPKTRRRVIVEILACFKWCVDRKKLIASHPYRTPDEIDLRGRRAPNPMYDEEISLILKHAVGDLGDICRYLAWTIARVGEARQLIWPWIDWGHGAAIPDTHKTMNTQSADTPRVIPLCGRAMDLLRDIRQRNRPSEYVFLNGTRRWTKKHLCARFRDLRLSLGLRDKCFLRGFRHLGITDLTGSSNLKTASLCAGHASTRTTEGYTHLGQVAGLRKAMDVALAERDKRIDGMS